ncbi:hypothetical protein ACIA8G_35455 [Lentzea sp. NPDC051213]|uniref:hypothetical protein n=1 Tax=Lentzea sp. NPDC051213 TaxID=3364126 RepID=UPI0037B5DE7E
MVEVRLGACCVQTRKEEFRGRALTCGNRTLLVGRARFKVGRACSAQATAEIFQVGVPFAVLALLAVVFIKEKPLKEASGDDRLAAEMAAGH